MEHSLEFDARPEWELFSRQAEPVSTKNTLWRSHLAVSGMHCAACAIKLEKALQSVPGIISSEVSATNARVSILWDASKTKPSVWMDAARTSGYELAPTNRSSFTSATDKESKLALWRWLVAGFCMMQIMMYAAPQYFAGNEEISTDIVALLRWASWVLSLPLMFFSSGPFFTSAFRDLRDKHIGMDLPVALGIAITFIVSTVATFQPDGWLGKEVYFDSLSMFVFFILSGRWLEQRLREKSASTLNNLENTIPDRVERKLHSGKYETIAVARLSVGDVVRIPNGQKFPADGTLINGSTFVSEAFLTGESRPLKRVVGNQILAGSFNLSNPCEMQVENLGDLTRISQITKLMQQASVEKPRLALLADRIAKPFLALVLVAAALAALYWWSIDPVDPTKGLMSAVAILIVTCPCALSLATPSAVLNSAGALASKGVLICRLPGIEAMSQIDTVVFDKTGTLTKGELGLKNIFPRPGIDPQLALELAANLAEHSLHPVSRAITNHRTATGTNKFVLSNIREIPGQGMAASLESLDDQNTMPFSAGRITFGNAKFCGVQEVIGNTNQVYLADQSGLIARFELDEVARTDAANSVAHLQAAGLQVRLMSGDQLGATEKIAHELGILEFDAECTPEKKLQLLREMQQAGHKVLMVGDGINDGPAISGAHVSIAIGSDVPIARAQADFVILNERLNLIPMLHSHAKRTMNIVFQNLLWAALYNAACVPLALLGYLPPWAAGLGMASSSILVIANASRLSRIRID
jgi:P-type Cu2+ transporter